MQNFQRYAAYYDLLYQDKDYASEAKYVADKIRGVASGARTILELGSGTGRHGRLLACLGFEVHGIERSADMATIAQATSAEGPGTFTCETGDIRATSLDRHFDAIISLFHVISYQTSNDDLLAVFRVAANHLRPGGIFLFDVWHGPAVLAQRPLARAKEAADSRYKVSRSVNPTLDANTSVVTVRIDMKCMDRVTGAVESFSEEHAMRYLFPTEIDLLARACGLQVIAAEEFLSGAPPSESSWGVAYLLTK